MKQRILVVDDDIGFLDTIRRGLITSGFRNIRAVADPSIAAADIESGEAYDLALIDVSMPGMNGDELLQRIIKASPETECIMVTAHDDARMAVKCLKLGAYDYLVKPMSKENLMSSIERALERKRNLEILNLTKHGSLPEIRNREAFEPIITQSTSMLRILKEAELHAESDIPILITGETGTGKELLAKAIHASSSRATSVFMPLNMGSLTATLFDAEFFGHKKGAFTGAENDHSGYLETANRGTLFLDEIANLASDLQGKLLRVLQEGEFMKIGTATPRRVDVRFISATNADVDRLMRQNLFRRDLYYRLRGGWINLPPLRKRKEDIPLLAKSFIRKFAGAAHPGIDPEALQMLMDYNYPGNIRELKAIIQSALNLAQGGSICSRHLAPDLHGFEPSDRATSPQVSGAKQSLWQVEKSHIMEIYRQTGQNKSQTARILDIALNTLRKKLESYGMD